MYNRTSQKKQKNMSNMDPTKKTDVNLNARERQGIPHCQYTEISVYATAWTQPFFIVNIQI
jgi:hypothetical protein